MRLLQCHFLLRVAAVWLAASCYLTSMATARALSIEEIETPLGIKAWFIEDHRVALVTIRFEFAGGASQDPAGKEGLTNLLSNLLLEGGGDWPATMFTQRVSQSGARLYFSTERDVISGGLETLADSFPTAAALLRLAMVAPRFDADAVARMKSQALTGLSQANNDPTHAASERWYADAFDGHPYARPPGGTSDSIARLTVPDLRSQYERLLARDMLKVVVVGDIEKTTVTAALDEIFGRLPLHAQLTRLPVAAPHLERSTDVVEMILPQATAVFGFPALRPDDPDFTALMVLNHVVGSGDFDSLLMDEMRVKRGLVYSIKTSTVYDSNMSLLLGRFSAKNEAMSEAVQVLEDVLVRTSRVGPTAAAVENAKRYLEGAALLDLDSNASIASSLLRAWRGGEGRDFLAKRHKLIAGVSLTDVKRVASRVFNLDQMRVTIAGTYAVGTGPTRKPSKGR